MYGLVYGTGLFGASGATTMPDNGERIGSPSTFRWTNNFGTFRHEGALEDRRFTVYVPDPSGIAMFLPVVLLQSRRGEPERFVMTFQTLEPRRLLSVSIDDDIATITGTEAAEKICRCCFSASRMRAFMSHDVLFICGRT